MDQTAQTASATPENTTSSAASTEAAAAPAGDATSTPASAPPSVDEHAVHSAAPPDSRAWRSWKEEARQLLYALTSEDPPTRRMALLFYASLFSLIGVSVQAVRHIHYLKSTWVHELTEEELELKARSEFMQRQAVRDAFKATMAKLGRFIVELKPPAPDTPLGKATVEFELVVRLNDGESKDYVEGRIVQARGEVVTALLHSKRTDFLTSAGKHETEKKLTAHLQGWLNREFPAAKVQEILFTNLLVR